MEKFCQKYPDIPYDRNRLVEHTLVFNKKRKVMFCLVEKNGNSNIRLLLFKAAGYVPPTTPQDQYTSIINKHTHQIHAGYQRVLRKGETMESIWPQYFKMVMVRNPLDRLVSGYKNKIGHPVLRERSERGDINYSNDRRLEVFKSISPDKYEEWLHNKSIEYTVSFSEFIQFVIKMPNVKLDVHFRPVINICSPCSVQYDFYGAFKNFKEDSQFLVEKLGGKPEYIYRHRAIASGKAADLLDSYYSQLSPAVKEQLFRDWYRELEFYYHLYPEERHSHKALLNIDEDIPITID